MALLGRRICALGGHADVAVDVLPLEERERWEKGDALRRHAFR